MLCFPKALCAAAIICHQGTGAWRGCLGQQGAGKVTANREIVGVPRAPSGPVTAEREQWSSLKTRFT